MTEFEKKKKLNKILARIKKLEKRASAGKKSSKQQLCQAKKDLTLFYISH